MGTTTVREALKTTVISKGGQNYSLSVTTSAVSIESNDSSTETRTIRIYNDQAATVYIGFAGVTTAIGYPLLQNKEFKEAVTSGQKLYIIAGSSTSVRVMESW